VSGERRRPPGPDRVYQQMEIEHGRFERHVPLSEPVDADAAAASYERGLLTIVLPVAERRVATERVTIVIQRSVS
jgi:HSP20 family protein